MEGREGERKEERRKEGERKKGRKEGNNTKAHISWGFLQKYTQVAIRPTLPLITFLPKHLPSSDRKIHISKYYLNFSGVVSQTIDLKLTLNHLLLKPFE